MRYFMWLLLLASAPAFAWVECDPDAISADRFEMSNLLDNGNFINGDPDNKWSISGDVQSITENGDTLVIGSPVPGSSGNGGGFSITQSFPHAGSSRVCASARVSALPGLFSFNPPTMTMIVEHEVGATFKVIPSRTGPFVVAMETGNPEPPFEGFRRIEIAVEWGQIDAGDQKFFIFDWVKITTIPRPGNTTPSIP